MANNGRSAPADGYDFPSKRDYRRRIWAYFGREIKNRKEAHVCLLTDTDPGELHIALKHGFREDHIHAVNHEPAVIATVRRKSGLSRMNTYGRDIAEACELMAKNGVRLSAANLDLCGCASGLLSATLKRIFASGVFGDGALVAVTMLRGREQGSSAEFLRNFPPIVANSSEPHYGEWVRQAAGEPAILSAWSTPISPSQMDIGRMQFGFAAGARGLLAAQAKDPNLVAGALVVRAGSYKSVAGNQTMLWFIIKVRLTDKAQFVANTRQAIADAKRLSNLRFVGPKEKDRVRLLAKTASLLSALKSHLSLSS